MRNAKEEIEKQNLLNEAKQKYPVGTKFIPAHIIINAENRVLKIVEGIDFIWSGRLIKQGLINNIGYESVVYDDGKWAKRYVFTTEDDVDIFENDEYWIISELSNSIFKNIVNNLDKTLLGGAKRFSTKEAAQEYLDKFKEKTLEDYENMLLKSNNVFYLGEVKNSTLIYPSFTASTFYKLLKYNEPKFYWLKILQLIVDDLNEDWKIDFNNSDDIKWFIVKHRGDIKIDYWRDTYYNDVTFKSKDLAEKAIKIMGDKLKNIFDV